MRDYNRNASGCLDLTATEAIERVDKAEADRVKRVSTFVSLTKYLAGLSGFKLLNRIELMDIQSGRIYR